MFSLRGCHICSPALLTHLNMVVSVWFHPAFSLGLQLTSAAVVFSWPVLNFGVCVVLGVAVAIVPFDAGRFRVVGGWWIAVPVHYMA